MVVGRDLEPVRVPDQGSGKRFRSCYIGGWWGGVRRHWSLVTDDERFDINVCDQNSSAEEANPDLRYSRVEHVSEKSSRCGKVRDAAWR